MACPEGMPKVLSLMWAVTRASSQQGRGLLKSSLAAPFSVPLRTSIRPMRSPSSASTHQYSAGMTSM